MAAIFGPALERARRLKRFVNDKMNVHVIDSDYSVGMIRRRIDGQIEPAIKPR